MKEGERKKRRKIISTHSFSSCIGHSNPMKLNNWKQFVKRDPSTIIILISNKLLAVKRKKKKAKRSAGAISANLRKILLLLRVLQAETPVDYLLSVVFACGDFTLPFICAT